VPTLEVGLPRWNVFVLGIDDLNLEALQAIPGARDAYHFHPLLTAEELIEAEDLHMRELLDKAEGQLREWDGPIDAVVGYWDFPVSSMVPILCRRFHLHGPDLEAVVKCEHKYWSRLEQAKVITEHPRFGIVDLDGSPRVPDGMDFPLWLKPVKSASSELAFHVKDQQQFEDAVAAIREGVDRVGKPFEFVLEHIDLPQEVADAGGRACLAEEEVSGRQVTVEGYSYDGRPHVHGIIDSHTYPDSSSFLRFQYPSSVPSTVAERLVDVSERVITQVGLGYGTFNIEYFWDPDTDEINLLEVNPRHSQSHAMLFEYVDGVPNHQAMVQLGLGLEPGLPNREGPYPVAGKCFWRRFSDGHVRRRPTAEEVEQVERDIPGVKVNIVAEQGRRLSDLPSQDSYSYELADIFVGGDDESDVVAKYERCVDALAFEFDE
jgi:biotin carboxylase